MGTQWNSECRDNTIGRRGTAGTISETGVGTGAKVVKLDFIPWACT